jgi:hypothetical protein
MPKYQRELNQQNTKSIIFKNKNKKVELISSIEMNVDRVGNLNQQDPIKVSSRTNFALTHI